jgi:simple sugar transport system substrate-binding protein
MKKFLIPILCLGLLFLAGCKARSGTENVASIKEAPADLPTSGKRVAYILNTVSTDIFKMAVQGATDTAKALGISIDVYFTDTDNVKFQDFVNNCANQNYAGMFLSHGNQETAFDLITMLMEKGIKVVCFDTQLVNKSGQKTSIEGVTQMFQDDQKMADLLLDYICNTLYPEKVAVKQPVKILKFWRGPGISPFDRRQETYLKYEQSGLISTIEILGPIDPANGEASMAQVVASALPKYPKGAVDAIWSCYDSYARGAYIALTEANVSYIPMVSVDISNQDINFMMDDKNIWKACATVDFTTVGQQGIRILAQKIAGEANESVYNLTPSLGLGDNLTQGANVINLKEIIPGYGINGDHISPWMAPYLK